MRDVVDEVLGELAGALEVPAGADPLERVARMVELAHDAKASRTRSGAGGRGVGRSHATQSPDAAVSPATMAIAPP